MSDLTDKTCEPCQGGIPPMESDELKDYRDRVSEEWDIVDEHHLEREFDFPDFKTALAFTNTVGEIAETEGHHPDIHLTWGTVRITIYTHKIDGLHENDFILAAKIDDAFDDR
jgi:4a-hydroxytetrahydrobiopterin dehydratase